MSRHSNELLLQQTYKALIEGDREALDRLVTPDARIHVPGRNVVSGDYQGFDAMVFFFQRLVSLTDSTYHRELIDALIGEKHAAALVHVTGLHGARHLDINLILVMQIEGNHVVDLRGYYSDQAAWDAFWADQMLTGDKVPEFQPPKRPIDP
jgi:ketosteroid isomerase-like protein